MTDPAPFRLRYDEGCLAAHALNMIGDRWALLVVRELSLTPKRFQMIRAGLPGITAAVLTQRLAQLQAAGVVGHDAAMGAYGLTASGQGLRPVLQALCRWGAPHPGHDPRRFISPTALMISMTAMLDGAARTDIRAGFRSGREGFRQWVAEGMLQVVADPDPRADFVIEGTGNALARAVYGADPPDRIDGVTLQGDLSAAKAFMGLFRLPVSLN
ncbi:transcriptional regulator [Paracoccus liaowanqingii]|uniref:Transcriptional regulator n=1 Tax=Paracoccus liaowanqingii TaxID=2560053 RepID=A0A4Z1BM94_9RHOB|nr:helix-turn-helix domain-containing protein [Paracoccus liaowanqingii]TGN62310.1 transcriptional regulator [Paracoccus liaowanqingii]